MSRRIAEVTTDSGLSKTRARTTVAAALPPLAHHRTTTAARRRSKTTARRRCLSGSPSSLQVTVPSTSKSNSEEAIVPTPKQHLQAEQQNWNWLDLPSDVTANILHRVGVVDILENAQKVCTAWYKICKDPALWRVICICSSRSIPWSHFEKMCKHAVDRSQGQLVDITITDVFIPGLVKYIANRSSQLKRLALYSCDEILYGRWTKIFEKIVLLEELDLYDIGISKEDIECAGRCCPMLKTLKVSECFCIISGVEICDEAAIAIGKNLHELRHLEIVASGITNFGLQVILDGCPHLEFLDLHRCWEIDLKRDIGKRCSEQIKCLKLPNDSCKDCSRFLLLWR